MCGVVVTVPRAGDIGDEHGGIVETGATIGVAIEALTGDGCDWGQLDATMRCAAWAWAWGLIRGERFAAVRE